MDENLKKKNYYNALYAYYQPLLTSKQQKIFEDYYFEDYSLAEIAIFQGVSRNAIWDLLKHVEHNLDEYETKLGLKKKNLQLVTLLDTLEKHTDQEGQKIIKKIKEME